MWIFTRAYFFGKIKEHQINASHYFHPRVSYLSLTALQEKLNSHVKLLFENELI